MADLSEEPVVLYDIPYRTGVALELPTLLTLAARPQIQAVKDCVFHQLVPLIGALCSESNPGPVKAALAAQGLIRDELRAPMTRATGELRERLRRWVAA